MNTTWRSSCLELLVRRRRSIQIGVDGVAWLAALTFASLVRLDFDISRVEPAGLVAISVLAALIQVLAGFLTGLYTGKWRFGSFDEVAALVPATMGTTLVLFVANAWVTVNLVPRSVPVAGGMASLVLMAGVRYTWRLLLERRQRPSTESSQRLVVFGAGQGSAQVVTAMLRDPVSPYRPVALLDDDPAKRRLRIMGVPVAGTRHDLEQVVGRYRADALLIAVPSADSQLMADLLEHTRNLDIPVKVLPPVGELLDADVGVADIREVSVTDLVGRRAIETDIESVASYLTGKRVLVTGAGGSIGSELCRQIFRFAPAELIKLDRDESALHALQLSMEGTGLLDCPNLVLADLRDTETIRKLMADRRPEVVFHAAALKHLPMLERYPDEGYKTNVVATAELLAASAEVGVERFVNISTDKAADPTSVLGHTKRIAERLTAWYGQNHDGTYVSVRFGNVFGSRGSVLSTFCQQIERGGPITVTHPEVTRYLMSVQEAVQLVIQAGAIGTDGKVLVLDMGEAVKIADMARFLAARARRHIEIIYTGLRPGEKLEEVLFGEGETDVRPNHPLISEVGVIPLAAGSLLPSAHPPDATSIPFHARE